MASTCPRCGSARSGTGRYCSHCAYDFWGAAAGYDQQQQEDAPRSPQIAGQPPSSSAPQPATGSGSNRLALWIGGGVVLVVVLAVGYGLMQDTADRIFQNVGDALASIDGERDASPARTPRPTPAATQVPSSQFAAIELSGTGNGVPRFTIPEEAVAIADITHVGASNFIVFTVDAAGNEQELLVNTIGNYSGTLLFDAREGQHTVAFSVEADGAWTIGVHPISAAFRWDQAANLTGTGDDVAVLVPPTGGLTTVNVSHSGESNFVVYAYGSAGIDLLVNEIGSYAGESLLASGTFLLQITADGAWTMTSPQ